MGDNADENVMRLDDSNVEVVDDASDDRSLFFDLSVVDFFWVDISTTAGDSSSVMPSLLFVPYTRCMLMSASRLSVSSDATVSSASPLIL